MKLSKLVGRNQLPGDRAAFDRLAQVFANAAPGPINSQRRQRITRPDGKTEINNEDKK